MAHSRREEAEEQASAARIGPELVYALQDVANNHLAAERAWHLIDMFIDAKISAALKQKGIG